MIYVNFYLQIHAHAASYSVLLCIVFHVTLYCISCINCFSCHVISIYFWICPFTYETYTVEIWILIWYFLTGWLLWIREWVFISFVLVYVKWIVDGYYLCQMYSLSNDKKAAYLRKCKSYVRHKLRNRLVILSIEFWSLP